MNNYETELDIHKICKKYYIENYTINDDGSIDVDGDINLHMHDLTELPLKFRNVIGNFNCNKNKLITLKGSPGYVAGNFYFYDNQLTSLEHCPKFVGGSLNFTYNKLTSLEHCTEFIDGNFWCKNNQLTSLKFMPKCNNYINYSNNNIRDFKYFIEPGLDFYCESNPIYEIWKLFEDKSYIELINEYDCIRGEGIVIDRFNEFLEEIDRNPVKSVDGYNNI